MQPVIYQSCSYEVYSGEKIGVKPSLPVQKKTR